MGLTLCVSKLLSCILLNSIGMNNNGISNINDPVKAFTIDRRSSITAIVSTIANVAIERPKPVHAMGEIGALKTFDDRQSVKLPLERCGGGGMCVRFTISSSSSQSQSPFRVIKAIVDTGSPYVVIPGEDDDDGFDQLPAEIDQNPLMRFIKLFLSKYNDNDNDEMRLSLEESIYPPTEEIYGSQIGVIQWKTAMTQFRDPNLITNSNSNSNKLILGVMDDALTKESGGALLGLVKHANDKPNNNKIQIRPTFLDQERIQSLILNDDDTDTMTKMTFIPITSFIFNPPERSLILSNQSLLPTSDQMQFENIIPLVDLRPLGDFVEHYACYVQNLFLNDIPIYKKQMKQQQQQNRDIVAVFDSGLTGCLLTQGLWDEIEKDGIIQPNHIDYLKVQINTQLNNKESSTSSIYSKKQKQKQTQKQPKLQTSQKLVSIASGKMKSPLFYVSPITLDWFDDESTAPHVIVLGQAFLANGALTIDIENRKALFEEYHEN